MNAEKIREVAQVVQGLDPADFDMNTYGNRGPGRDSDCGCIAYWTLRTLQPDLLAHLNAEDDPDDLAAVPASAAEELGLDGKTAVELFLATRWDGKRSEITPTHAARVLTELAESGRVMWGPAREVRENPEHPEHTRMGTADFPHTQTGPGENRGKDGKMTTYENRNLEEKNTGPHFFAHDPAADERMEENAMAFLEMETLDECPPVQFWTPRQETKKAGENAEPAN